MTQVLFRLLPLCWDLEGVNICMLPLTADFLVSYSCLALLDIKTTGFQSQILWEIIFPVQVTQAGEPDVGLSPHSSGEDFQGYDIPPAIGLQCQQ